MILKLKLPSKEFLYAWILCSIFLFNPYISYADTDPNFFRLTDQWDERFVFKGVEQFPDKDRVGFLKGHEGQPVFKGPAAEYFQKDIEESDEYVIKPPEPVDVLLSDLRVARQTFELEAGQVATIRARGVQRYAATTQNKVDFFLPDADALQIKGQNIGSTFVHIWDNEGRVTIPIKVVPSKRILEYAKRVSQEQIERPETFKLGYEQTRSAFYQGNSYPNLDQNTLSYTQGFTVEGETPFGQLSGDAQIRELNNKTELSSISAQLADATIGPFSDFDLNLADQTVNEGLIILPSYRFRGVGINYTHPENDRLAFRGFYGRELNSIFGTLSPTDDGNETLDSFAGGLIHDIPINEKLDWRLAYVQAYGRHRPDDLNNNAAEWIQEYRMTDELTFKTDVAYDDSRFSYRIQGIYEIEPVTINMEYRDISKYFFTIVGNPGAQGEQGVITDIVWSPWEDIEINYRNDTYRDRLFFSDGERDRFNVRQDTTIDWKLTPRSSVNFYIKDHEEMALVSPFRDEEQAVAYHQSFDLFNHRISTFARLRHQDHEVPQSPDSFYRRDGLTLGIQTTVLNDWTLSYEDNMSILEETNIRSISNPRSMVYSASYQAQIPNTPISTDFSVRYTDEEETESARSFLIGEDRLEISAGARYEIDNMEFYIDGRYSNIGGENETNENVRAEAEFITGVRYVFDTGIRWETQNTYQGIVFNDLNNNGVQDEGETGMADIVILAGGEEIPTDADGRFQTAPIPGKKAIISVAPQSLPYGFSGSTVLRQVIKAQDSGDPVLFGLVTRSTVAGIVFNDLNCNGEFDPTDVGLDKVRLVLDGDRARISNRQGRYRFLDVEIGKHQVVLDLGSLPLGYLPVGKLKRDIEVYEGVRYRLNFAVTAQKTLSGRVFLDENDNGVFETDEQPLAEAKVLFGALNVLTDKNGYYFFDQIPAGTHTLTIHPKSVPQYDVIFSQDIKITNEPFEDRIDIPVVK